MVVPDAPPPPAVGLAGELALLDVLVLLLLLVLEQAAVTSASATTSKTIACPLLMFLSPPLDLGPFRVVYGRDPGRFDALREASSKKAEHAAEPTASG
jgi:hypothetical protein